MAMISARKTCYFSCLNVCEYIICLIKKELVYVSLFSINNEFA
jgi:hypothetical protein